MGVISGANQLTPVKYLQGAALHALFFLAAYIHILTCPFYHLAVGCVAFFITWQLGIRSGGVYSAYEVSCYPLKKLKKDTPVRVCGKKKKKILNLRLYIVTMYRIYGTRDTPFSTVM